MEIRASRFLLMNRRRACSAGRRGGQFHKTLQWLRCRREAERLAEADAEALIRDHGAEAYGKARQRERAVVLPDGTTHAGRTPVY